MTDDRVRMHLAQALTRVEDPDAHRHLQAAMTILNESAARPTTTTSETATAAIAHARTDLERWLVATATAGVPETVLPDILRAYADRVERRGHVPRSWHHNSDAATPAHAAGRGQHD